MKKKCLLLFFLVTTTAIFAQHKYTLSGSISDASNGEKLLGVNFVIKELHTGTSTNEYGFYSITLPEGKYTLSIEYIGYGTREETIVLNKNIRKDYKLIPEEIALTGVEITAHNTVQKTEVRKPEMSVATIPITTVKKLPVLVGEVDIIKTLMQMPGVSNAGEASSGFNVRGGAADQNLVLLDEATIFNASHLFGFLSVFNADAVRDMKLYKGGIPARYGGRIASVLDIYQKEGNKNKETYFRNVYGNDVFAVKQKRETPITTLAHKVNFSADYQLNTKSRLGFYYFYQFSKEDNKAYGTNLTSWKKQEQWRNIDRQGRNLENIHSGTLQYVYANNNYSLDISQEIASTNINHNTQTLESGAGILSLVKSHGNRRYTVYTTNIDNSFRLPWKINAMAGILYNYVDSKSKTNSEIPYLNSQNYINNINVKESNPQAYLSFSRTFGKWTIMPAARYQYIHRTIGSVSGTNTKENLFKQNFSTLCPVVTIKYRPNDNWFFQLNYRKNLTQPNFAQLNF